MAYCEKCGEQVAENVKFCPSCGAQTGQSGAAQQQQQQQQTVFGSTPPTMPGAPTQSDINDATENKTMAIIAYILFFVPLLAGTHKTSEFVRFHTNQGTVLFLASFAWSICYGILSGILALIPIFGWLLIPVIGLTGFVFLAFCVMGILNAVNGRMKQLPLIGNITLIR